MDDFDRKIIRRHWLNQVLSWCIRGKVGSVEYTREQIQDIIENDESAAEMIPEAPTILQMFKAGKATKVIEVYIRQILRSGKDKD